MTTAAPVRRAGGGVPLDAISLRKSERGLIVGGTGSGKSTLADALRQDFVRRYYAAGGRCLVLDSKPRYRAQFTANGLDASRRYRTWSHGQPIKDSVVVDDPGQLAMAWKSGARTVIAQCDGANEIPRLTATAAAFLASSTAKRPQLLYVDETMDFFHGNGAPIGGNDALVRAARAGRERGTAAMYSSQRTHGIPATIMEELERLYCMRIDYKRDQKRFQEMGAPDFDIPKQPYEFKYWYKGDYTKVWGPYKLEIGK